MGTPKKGYNFGSLKPGLLQETQYFTNRATICWLQYTALIFH